MRSGQRRRRGAMGLPSRVVAVAVLAGVAATAAAAAAAAATAARAPAHRGPLSSVSGRIAAGNSKTSCIYGPWGSNGWSSSASAVSSVLATITAQTGVTYHCIETFSDADPQWSDWVSPWVTRAAYGFAAWLAQDPGRRTVVLTQNLIPDSEANVADPLTWEQPCAAGAFDSYATQLARNLVATGFGSSVIRLGHEMNGTWYNDDTGSTLQEQHAWAHCFAREVTAMRAVPGSHLRFDWNVNACYQSVPLANYYPGDRYVDIVGVDQYDGLCDGTKATPSAATFRALVDQPSATSFASVAAFAAAHGKPLSIPEWGLRGLGDDPYFVSGIASFVATHDVAYQSYFDNGDQGVLQLGPTTPLATAAYRRGAGA